MVLLALSVMHFLILPTLRIWKLLNHKIAFTCGSIIDLEYRYAHRPLMKSA